MKLVFWSAAALIAYTYVGYAAWLWLRSKLFPWPVLRGAQEPNVSVVMVVRNEEKTIERKLRNLLSMDYPAERLQIVVVSDGSTDRTETILREYASDPRLHAVMHQLSQGKASGLNDALEWATGEIVMFVDARQKIETRALRFLLESFADPEVGCVSGELMLGDPDSGESKQGMGLYWRVEKNVRELESASDSVVGATGAIYAVRRELLAAVPAGTILDDVFIPMQVVRQGKRVIFDSRARAWDSPDLGGGQEFSRKVRTLGGNYQLMQLEPWILSLRNPLLFEFVSHKFLRLIMPFALVLALLSSVTLSGIFYRAIMVLQIAFYGLSVMALAGFPKVGVFGRAADAAGTFVTLNAAAVVAFAHFAAGRKTSWTPLGENSLSKGNKVWQR